MQELKISKGMAYMIRAILNIEPEKLQVQLNNMIQMAECAATGINKAVTDFDARLKTLEASHSEIATMLKRWDHERHDYNAGNTITDNRAKPAADLGKVNGG